MGIVKLDATDSTNSYLKRLMLSQKLDDYTTVSTSKQLKGRGQMGTVWESEPNKNLTFSILKYFNDFKITDRFLLTICISKAIYTSLAKLNVPDLAIKWPNDILSGRSKIGGILIENIISGSFIKSSIIGIGLNVNQINFKGLDNVTSLHLLLQEKTNLNALLLSILEAIKMELVNIENMDMAKAILSYESLLFKKGVPTAFANIHEEKFMGIIQGISTEGKLKVLLENDTVKEYGLKEIKLLY